MTNILSRVLPKPESDWQVSRLEYSQIVGGFTGPKTTKIKCVLADPNASTTAASSTVRAKSGPVSEGSDTIPEDENAPLPQRELTISVMSKYCSCPHTDVCIGMD